MSRPIDWNKIGVVDEETTAKLRTMTPAEKIQMASDLNRAARQRAAVRLKQEHPDWTEQQAQAEIAKKCSTGDEDFFK